VNAQQAPNPVDAHLDDVATKVLAWKNPTMRQIMATILVRVDHVGQTIWPDEVDLRFVTADDKNCIGICWRLLVKFGILSGTAQFRRSSSGASKGRKIFAYSVGSVGLARALERRTGIDRERPLRQAGLSV
jgi:hypothetical protein